MRERIVLVVPQDKRSRVLHFPRFQFQNALSVVREPVVNNADL